MSVVSDLRVSRHAQQRFTDRFEAGRQLTVSEAWTAIRDGVLRGTPFGRAAGNSKQVLVTYGAESVVFGLKRTPPGPWTVVTALTLEQATANAQMFGRSSVSRLKYRMNRG